MSVRLHVRWAERIDLQSAEILAGTRDFLGCNGTQDVFQRSRPKKIRLERVQCRRIGVAMQRSRNRRGIQLSPGALRSAAAMFYALSRNAHLEFHCSLGNLSLLHLAVKTFLQEFRPIEDLHVSRETLT